MPDIPEPEQFHEIPQVILIPRDHTFASWPKTDTSITDLITAILEGKHDHPGEMG